MGPTVAHKYKKPGKYKVKLTLTDDDHCSTRYISAGQTAYCNGGKRARKTVKVKVAK